MTFPELGRVGVWGHLDTLPIAAARAYARRVEELGYGSLWVPETVGREPFTFLGLLAGETSRLVLGTSIVSIWGHDAQASRMAAETLAEATAGRFVLGLGVSHPHLAASFVGTSSIGHSPGCASTWPPTVPPSTAARCRYPAGARRGPP